MILLKMNKARRDERRKTRSKHYNGAKTDLAFEQQHFQTIQKTLKKKKKKTLICQ